MLDFIFSASVYSFTRNLKDLCGVAQWIGVISLASFVPSSQHTCFGSLLLARLCIARFWPCLSKIELSPLRRLLFAYLFSILYQANLHFIWCNVKDYEFPNIALGLRWQSCCDMLS